MINNNLFGKQDFEKIKEYLITSQKLKVRSRYQQQVFDNGVFDVLDESLKEYSLLFYSKIYGQEWSFAQNNIFSLNRFRNRNILKTFRQFESKEFGFILIEQCESTLQKWVMKNKTLLHDQQLLIDIALQIIKGARAITDRQWPLGYICLDNILVNKEKVIKLTNASFHPKYQLSNLKKDFQDCNQQKKIFYFPLKYIEEKESQKQEEFYFQDIAVYQIGLCLYAMSGASEEHIINFIQGKENFQIQYSLGLQINSAIAYILLQQQSKIGYSFIQNTLENVQLGLSKTNISTDEKESLKQETDNHNNLKKEIDEEERTKIDQFMQIFIEGILNQNQNNHEQALESFQKCIQIEPNNEFCYYCVGWIYYHSLREYEESKQFMRKILSANDQNVEAHILLGQIFEEQQLINEAKECYESAIKFSNRYSRAYILLGLIYYFAEKDKVKANAYMQGHSVDLDDFDDKSLERLAKYYLTNNDINSVESCYKKLIERNQTNYKYYIELINLYEKKNYKYKFAALQYIQKAIEIEPNMIEAYLRLFHYYSSSDYKLHRLLICKKLLKICKSQSLDTIKDVINKIYSLKLSSCDDKALKFSQLYYQIIIQEDPFATFFIEQTKSKI